MASNVSTVQGMILMLVNYRYAEGTVVSFETIDRYSTQKLIGIGFVVGVSDRNPHPICGHIYIIQIEGPISGYPFTCILVPESGLKYVA